MEGFLSQIGYHLRMKKLFFLAILLSETLALTQENCLSGLPGQNHLIEQFNKAKSESPISKIISEKYGLGPKTEADCPTCSASAGNSNLEDLRRITKEKSSFKIACLEAAAKIQTGSKQISCPDKKIANHSFCYTKPMAEYQNAVVSEFYKCLKSVNPMPVTMPGLFDIYTNESGFKSAYINGGGTGIGQLTSIFIDDLHQKHRGYSVLNSINTSLDKSCESAKKIVSKDLLQKPTLQNICDFTQYGEGFERNILYSISGMASAWNKDYAPIMKNYNKTYADHPLLQKAQEKVILNGYGSGGRAAGRAAFIRLSGLPPDKFIKAMDKPLYGIKKSNGKSINLTSYATKTKKKQDTIGKTLPEPLKSEFKTEGSTACME